MEGATDKDDTRVVSQFHRGSDRAQRRNRRGRNGEKSNRDENPNHVNLAPPMRQRVAAQAVSDQTVQQKESGTDEDQSKNGVSDKGKRSVRNERSRGRNRMARNTADVSKPSITSDAHNRTETQPQKYVIDAIATFAQTLLHPSQMLELICRLSNAMPNDLQSKTNAALHPGVQRDRPLMQSDHDYDSNEVRGRFRSQRYRGRRGGGQYRGRGQFNRGRGRGRE